MGDGEGQTFLTGIHMDANQTDSIKPVSSNITKDLSMRHTRSNGNALPFKLVATCS
jgi:hypothetical protein